MGGVMYNGNGLMTSLGGLFGFGIGTFGFLANLERYFIIRNNLTGFLVTQNGLKSFYDTDGPAEYFYGPGVHICYPWEIRSAGGNITLKEVASNITFTIQCTDGVLEGAGSYRLRPDMARPFQYLTGVGAAESELIDLIVVKIRKLYTGKPILKALTMNKQLEAELKKLIESTDGEESAVSKIEARFGVEISDITVAQLLPNEELQRTINAIGEANAIFIGVAASFGLTRTQAIKKLELGDITPGDWNIARDRHLSVSGNLEGMKINRDEFDINLRGIDGDAINSVAEILRNPSLQNLIMKFGGSASSGKAAADRLASRRERK